MDDAILVKVMPVNSRRLEEAGCLFVTSLVYAPLELMSIRHGVCRRLVYFDG
jgi:hypothetical protein